METYANLILWAYVILLLLGGLIGFFKAKSKISLVVSALFAALLALAAIPEVLQPAFARNMANIIMAILLVIFAVRLSQTKKFMPSGLMLIVTIVVLIARNIGA
ncbi:MAG: TMEM14 family protein [Candidatus Omnitrophica bacterium]|nr:TMEM14 family protein [Candidatus Omnitrophota bacterium]